MSSLVSAVQISKYFTRDVFGKSKSVANVMFQKYLLITNVGISASLSFAGDVIQQYYEMLQDDTRNWDKGRTFRMTIAGITVGFVCHYWYKHLEKCLPGRSLKNVFKKVTLDQLIGSPLYITVFFATTCTLEKRNFEEFKREIIQKWWRLYIAEWIIWPPAQVINFYFIHIKI